MDKLLAGFVACIKYVNLKKKCCDIIILNFKSINLCPTALFNSFLPKQFYFTICHCLNVVFIVHPTVRFNNTMIFKKTDLNSL